MNILFNCEYGTKVWTPHTLSGGSEEQTILLAKLFASAGHYVEVRNNVTEPRDIDGVKYIPVGEPILKRPDVYFGWRDYRVFWHRIDVPLRILLCHDVPNPPHFPSKEEISRGALRHIDYVHVLNRHHYDLYLLAGCPREKLRIIPIIVKCNPYVGTIEKDWFKCIWHCQPERGLPWFLGYWPYIKANVPEATLQVCWWNTSDRIGLPEPNERLGILPIKNLTHDELDQELASSTVFPYCSVFDSEISPASCLKAQNSGVYPIVIPKGGMRSTMGENGVTYCTPSNFGQSVVEHLHSQHWQKYDMELRGLNNLAKHRPEQVLKAWNVLLDHHQYG